MTPSRTDFVSVKGHGDFSFSRNTRISREIPWRYGCCTVAPPKPHRLGAARPLGTPVGPYNCGNSHGHTWTVAVVVSAPWVVVSMIWWLSCLRVSTHW